MRRVLVTFSALLLCGALTSVDGNAQDSLPSWTDGPVKKAIVEFVQATTTQGNPTFEP